MLIAMAVFMTALASGALPAQTPSASQAILDRALAAGCSAS
jgi:hypothetical protein